MTDITSCKHERRFVACPDCDARWNLKGTLWIDVMEENDRLRAENAKLRRGDAKG
jgi:hypothetical protein